MQWAGWGTVRFGRLLGACVFLGMSRSDVMFCQAFAFALGFANKKRVLSGDQAGELKEKLSGEVEEARKDAQVVAMTREEAEAQLTALEARLKGLLEEQQGRKVQHF